MRWSLWLLLTDISCLALGSGRVFLWAGRELGIALGKSFAGYFPIVSTLTLPLYFAIPEFPKHWGTALLVVVTTSYSLKHPQIQPLIPSPTNPWWLTHFSQTWGPTSRLCEWDEEVKDSPNLKQESNRCVLQRKTHPTDVYGEATCFLPVPGLSLERSSE